MTLSHDFICYADFQDAEKIFGSSWQDSDFQKLENNDFQFTYLFKKVIPVLQENGITDNEIKKFLIETPKNIFENGFRS